MRRGLWLWAVIACALLLHGTFLVQRVALERSNDTVELVVDYEGLAFVAEAAGMSPEQLLLRWQRLGIISVAIGGADADGDDRLRLNELAALSPRIVPRTLAVAKAAHARGWSVGPYIPRGEFVEGYPDGLGSTATALSELQLPIGLVEFAVAAGVAEVARQLGDDAVFVHSIPEKEIPRYTAESAVARFYRAAFERQARLLYVHVPVGILSDDEEPPSLRTSASLLEKTDSYILGITTAVERAGLVLGPAGSAPRWTTPWWLPVFAAAAAGAAFALLAGRGLDHRYDNPLVFLLPAGLALSIAVLFVLGKDVLARQGAALAVACVFPVLAILLGAEGAGLAGPGLNTARHRQTSRLSDSLRLMYGVGIVVATGLVGAVFVAGSLGDTLFMLKLEQFRGVKFAHVVPFIPLVGLAVVGALQASSGDGPGMVTDGSIAERPWRFAVRYVLLGLVVLGLGFIVVARTGHDVLPVSNMERAMREWLETTLPVRPRTKEFLLGYPALLVGLGLGVFRSGPRAVTLPFLIAGAIVPISIMNTFAHAHVPLTVSIVRTLLGLAAGGFIGLVALGGALLLAGRRRRVTRAVGQW